MDRSAVISLISETYSQNSRGSVIVTENSREIFAHVDSVTASEYFEGGRNGLNPEFRFTIFAYDYEGEKIVEFDGGRFSVYRVYKGRSDTLELYVERRQGDA